MQDRGRDQQQRSGREKERGDIRVSLGREMDCAIGGGDVVLSLSLPPSRVASASFSPFLSSITPPYLPPANQPALVLALHSPRPSWSPSSYSVTRVLPLGTRHRKTSRDRRPCVFSLSLFLVVRDPASTKTTTTTRTRRSHPSVQGGICVSCPTTITVDRGGFSHGSLLWRKSFVKALSLAPV